MRNIQQQARAREVAGRSGIAAMVSEADYITNQLVQKYGLFFQVVQRSSAPTFWIYELRKREDQMSSSLEKVLQNLAADIYEFRGNCGPTVSIDMLDQPLQLQVSRQDPQVLTWAANKMQVRPFEVVIGGMWLSRKGTPVIVDLSKDEFATVAVFGSPGSGKSTTIHGMCAGLMRSTSPDDVEVYGIDLEQNAFVQYADLPHFQYAASYEEEAKLVMKRLVACCHSDAEDNGKLKVLFIDELQILLAESEDKDEFLALLKVLFQRGRKWGVRVIIGTQNPDKQNFPPALKPLTRAMIAGVTPIDTYLVNQLGIKGAKSLNGNGDMLFYALGRRHRFNSFRFDAEEKISEVMLLKAKWGEDSTLLEIAPEPEEDAPLANFLPLPQGKPKQIKPGRKEKRIAGDVKLITPHMGEAYDFDREELLPGAAEQLLALIYQREVGDIKMEGNYRNRLLDAVEAWREQSEPNEPNAEVLESLIWELPKG